MKCTNKCQCGESCSIDHEKVPGKCNCGKEHHLNNKCKGKCRCGKSCGIDHKRLIKICVCDGNHNLCNKRCEKHQNCYCYLIGGHNGDCRCSMVEGPIHQHERNNGWYFWDLGMRNRCGPFISREFAARAYIKYCNAKFVDDNWTLVLRTQTIHKLLKRKDISWI